MVNWSDLPDDIISLFAKQVLPCVEDFVRFSCVSKSWRSSAIKQQQLGIPHCAPWLMLAKKEVARNINKSNEEGIQSFYSVSSKRVFQMTLPTPGRKCWGTPFGWLLTLGPDLSIHLYNPISGAQISLPPQPLPPDRYGYFKAIGDLWSTFVVLKMAMAPSPAPNYSLWSSAITSPAIPNKPAQCPLVMVIYGDYGHLAIARPGDESWTSVEGPLSRRIQDIVYFRDHFYVVKNDGEVGICDVSTSPPVATHFASFPVAPCVNREYYLIEISGDLHLVRRVESLHPYEFIEEYYDDEGNTTEDTPSTDPCKTSHFVVFKLNIQRKEWTEVKDLGDHALFVGNNQSFAISTADYPEFKGNCIYFTNDYEYFRTDDMGIYDISEHTVTSSYICKDEQSRFRRPLFFIPTPHDGGYSFST